MSTLPWHQAILVAVIIIALAIGFVAWLRVLFFQWKTISNRREGVRLFRDAPLRNPANILFRGELLTEKGLLPPQDGAVLGSVLHCRLCGRISVRFGVACIAVIRCRARRSAGTSGGWSSGYRIWSSRRSKTRLARVRPRPTCGASWFATWTSLLAWSGTPRAVGRCEAAPDRRLHLANGRAAADDPASPLPATPFDSDTCPLASALPKGPRGPKRLLVGDRNGSKPGPHPRRS